MTKRVLVTGAGGFIGHHLVKYLVAKGFWVRGADIKEPLYETTSAHEFKSLDLRRRENCMAATKEIDEVYNLAADMGGIGFISGNHADICTNNGLINTHMLEASRINGVSRFFFSSSACIYPMYLQQSTDVTPLKEEDAYPADSEEGYGWEKLYAEKLCQYYQEDYGLQTRVARFHNIYGPLGAYDGGREKAPAAISRKIALARDGDVIEIWGDGKQTRSFMYVTDCIEGIFRIMHSDHNTPLNLGTDVLITVDGLVDLIASIAGKTIQKRYDTSKPQGVRGRNSDNTRLTEVVGWKPRVSLAEGLEVVYHWIETELRKAGRTPSAVGV